MSRWIECKYGINIAIGLIIDFRSEGEGLNDIRTIKNGGGVNYYLK